MVVTGPEKQSDVTAFTFDQLGEAFGPGGAGSEADVLWLELGGRGHLGAADIVRAAEALHTAIGKLQDRQTLVVSIGGYEHDPRSLWDIPEARKFIRRVMRQAGITHWSQPAVKALNESSLALLLQCGVFPDHPFQVQITTEDNTTLHRYGRGR